MRGGGAHEQTVIGVVAPAVMVLSGRPRAFGTLATLFPS